MEKMTGFFEHIQSWQRMALLMSGILIFWSFEEIIPQFRLGYNKFRHAGLNLFFTLTTLIVNFAFAFLIVLASHYTFHRKIGLLNLFKMPVWLYILVGLMILDLISAWLIHWIQHKIKWMWKFHLVHHADTWVDTTTANRHHPVESLFRAVFTFLAVLIAGAPLWLVFLYQFLSVLFSQFNHANISLPKWLDQSLAWIIVSPNMHKVHHHFKQPLTDTNFGNIFSFWDRLFGTFVYLKHIHILQYGIDSCQKEEENNRIIKLLEIPFGEYRPPPGAKFNE